MTKAFHSLLFILCFFNSFSQYKNLVFEGGGIRGIAYVGAIQALEEQNKTQHIQNVAGTSVGAISASLFCVGYTSKEIKDILSSVKFQKFNDGQGIFIGGTNRMIHRYGWYKGEKLRKWVDELLFQKLKINSPTFRDLDSLSNLSPEIKNLYVTATNLSKQNWEVLSCETYPNMKICDAIRISASIPIYYTAIFMDKEGNTYTKPQNNIKTSVMADGGFLSNYPIHIFDEKFEIQETLGFKLDTPVQINSRQPQTIAPCEITNFKDYIGAFYNLVIESLNRQDLTSEDWERTIPISTEGIGPKVKKLKKEEVEILRLSGYNSTLNHLLQNSN